MTPEEIRDEIVRANAPVPYEGPTLTPDKANPSLPDHVWERLQRLGDVATQHLDRLINDAKFPKLSIKEQMKIIDTVMMRAYGAPDGGVRRNLHVHMNPEDNKGFNALSELASRAHRQFPEFQGSNVHPLVGRSRRSKYVKRDDVAVSHDTLDAFASEDIPGDGD